MLTNLSCAREITCHMGSHSVTYHPTEVILTPSPQRIAGTHLSTPEGWKARWDQPVEYFLVDIWDCD